MPTYEGRGTSELVVLNPEKLLDHGRTPGALGKKFARGITPPPCDCCCSGAEDGGGTCTEPGLVNEIPGAPELAPPVPFSPDPPFTFAFNANGPRPNRHTPPLLASRFTHHHRCTRWRTHHRHRSFRVQVLLSLTSATVRRRGCSADRRRRVNTPYHRYWTVGGAQINLRSPINRWASKL